MTGFAELPGGIRSALPENERPADYDRLARGYDLVVGNALYNRLVWGCPVREYTAAAERFLRQSDAFDVLDFGCGSLVFTADAYRADVGRLTLLDRSLGMLERARRRLPEGVFVQGDALDPPFAPASFGGAMSWGMLHVFGTGSKFLDQLASMVAPGSPVAISTLVLSERAIGNRMLSMLHARGEAARPETAEDVREAFGQRFGSVGGKQIGSMLFLNGKRR